MMTMGKDSKIEWTHHTYNPWWGCVKVSPGCEHCYAETFAKRTGHAIWGPAATTERRTFGDKHWAEPLKWNEDAAKAGERRRVFCASMADVFEDHPHLPEQRFRLALLMNDTPMLDWLLLTKRPENIMKMWMHDMDSVLFLSNEWIGTSVENQAMADKRIPALAKIRAATRFLSCEPLLGPLDLSPWLDAVQWVIVGGESGPKARPMQADWVRGIRDQCNAAGVAFLFKQWGGVRKHETGRELDGRTWDEYPKGQ
jgi:protein gp37